jgi:hypothetical protein
MGVIFNPSGYRLPPGIAGSPYKQTIDIEGGHPPYEIIIQGNWPGIKINFIDNSLIFGGTPSVMGTFAFTIIVMDSKKITGNKSYVVTFTLQKFAEDLGDLLENATLLKNKFNYHEYELLFYNFRLAQSNYYQIPNRNDREIVESVIDGLYDIVDSEYVSLNDSLELIITTLPVTIRLINNLA